MNEKVRDDFAFKTELCEMQMIGVPNEDIAVILECNLSTVEEEALKLPKMDLESIKQPPVPFPVEEAFLLKSMGYTIKQVLTCYGCCKDEIKIAPYSIYRLFGLMELDAGGVTMRYPEMTIEKLAKNGLTVWDAAKEFGMSVFDTLAKINEIERAEFIRN